jgi:hypothetical protein
MSEVDWSKAPEGAEACINGCFAKWLDGKECGWNKESELWNLSVCNWPLERYITSDCKVEVRPDKWKEGEKRMEQIQQNGNDGLVYDELDDYSKQPRYKGNDGLDHIDEFARDNSIEDFRAAMRFTIGKYEKRLGKKDAMSKELYKMSDYYKRWSEVEKKLEQEKGE